MINYLNDNPDEELQKLKDAISGNIDANTILLSAIHLPSAFVFSSLTSKKDFIIQLILDKTVGNQKSFLDLYSVYLRKYFSFLESELAKDSSSRSLADKFFSFINKPHNINTKLSFIKTFQSMQLILACYNLIRQDQSRSKELDQITFNNIMSIIAIHEEFLRRFNINPTIQPSTQSTNLNDDLTASGLSLIISGNYDLSVDLSELRPASISRTGDKFWSRILGQPVSYQGLNNFENVILDVLSNQSDDPYKSSLDDEKLLESLDQRTEVRPIFRGKFDQLGNHPLFFSANSVDHERRDLDQVSDSRFSQAEIKPEELNRFQLMVLDAFLYDLGNDVKYDLIKKFKSIDEIRFALENATLEEQRDQLTNYLRFVEGINELELFKETQYYSCGSENEDSGIEPEAEKIYDQDSLKRLKDSFDKSQNDFDINELAQSPFQLSIYNSWLESDENKGEINVDLLKQFQSPRQIEQALLTCNQENQEFLLRFLELYKKNKVQEVTIESEVLRSRDSYFESIEQRLMRYADDSSLTNPIWSIPTSQFSKRGSSNNILSSDGCNSSLEESGQEESVNHQEFYSATEEVPSVGEVPATQFLSRKREDQELSSDDSGSSEERSQDYRVYKFKPKVPKNFKVNMFGDESNHKLISQEYTTVKNFWHRKKRANKYKFFSDYKAQNPNEIYTLSQNLMEENLDLALQASGCSIKDVQTVIFLAKKYGSIKRISLDNNDHVKELNFYYKLSQGIDPAENTSPVSKKEIIVFLNKLRVFSKIYQENNSKKLILTGAINPKESVGLRLAFISQDTVHNWLGKKISSAKSHGPSI